ncbi:MAG: TonB-dependent receptor [Rhodothermales bacterium]
MTTVLERRSLYAGISSKALQICFYLLFLGCVSTVYAQTNPPVERDSLLSYDLAEIVVSDGSVFEAEANTVQKVSLAEIAKRNAVSVSDLARLIPAAHVQTNSRGESLIYLRNAGERQVGLFFNGALLNVPWDNRMNLDLVPANVIGGMTITKGVPSVLYGTNVLGGAINITSRTIDYEGSVTEIGGQFGDASTSNFSLTHMLSTGAFKFTGAAGYSTRDGMPLPDVSLFSQTNSDIRSNTDRTILNLFGQGSYQFRNGAEVGLSYLFIDGDFGIAPEGHVDPATSSVRFWRYPEFTNSTLVLNASLPLAAATILRGAVWGSWFGQHIDSYESDLYESLDERQQDEDNTLGTRITLNQEIGGGLLSVALNGLISEHSEKTLATLDTGSLEAAGSVPAEVFEQVVFSAGVEYATPVSEDFRINVGGSIDGIATPETGDKPSRDAQTGFGVSGGVQYRLSPEWLLRASAGRKVRFPTMRELFGVALNRFLLNPDLKPETSFVSELALVTNGDVFSGEVVGFFQRTYDTIDQERVTVDGVSLRRRINLDGSRGFGFELVGSARPIRSLLLNGHLTVMKPRAIEEGETTFQTEKPSVLGSFIVTHTLPSGFSLTGQATYTGRAYGRNDDNELVSLTKSLVMDTKASYLFAVGSGDLYTEAFVRVDNLFNVETLPQLGLPGAGRYISAGINISF